MNIFKGLLPFIFSAVAGKQPEVIKEVSSIMGLKGKSIDSDTVNELLKDATPEQLIQLKKLENDINEIHLANTISARQMNISNKDKFLPILSILTVGASFLMTGYLFCFGIPDSNKAIVYTLMGNILAWPTMILNFYYGSSMGSKEKSQIIANLQEDSILQK